MYKFIGDFCQLEKLGFVKNVHNRYYYLPLRKTSDKLADKFLMPLTINIDNREIEYSYEYQLDIIEKYIEEE